MISSTTYPVQVIKSPISAQGEPISPTSYPITTPPLTSITLLQRKETPSADMAGLNSFKAYHVVESGLTIENLAENLNLEISNLKFYNWLEDGNLLSVGEWLLISRPKEL